MTKKIRISLNQFKMLLSKEGVDPMDFGRFSAKTVADKYRVCLPAGVFDKNISRGHFALKGVSAVKSNTKESKELLARTKLPKVKVATRNRAKDRARDIIAKDLGETKSVKKTVTKKVTSAKAPVQNHVADATPVVAIQENYVPDVDQFYVPFGNFKDVKTVLEQGVFFPLFITGLSGNGKTTMIEQICAKLKRELIRVNITGMTDEGELIGGHRLVDGNTAWEDGPVIKAMERGAVLLLDEMDLGTPKIMCLQPVLEGKGIYIKAINRFVKPADGFTVVATGNTKGQGDDAGSFVGTNLMNEAMLDRFALTFEQDYPSATVEARILEKVVKIQTGKVVDKDRKDFIKTAVQWAKMIRKNYRDGDFDSVITTRRLVDLIKTDLVFNDSIKAVKLITARFNTEDGQAFVDVFKTLSNPETLKNLDDEHQGDDFDAVAAGNPS